MFTLNNQTNTMLISMAVKEIKLQNTGKDSCTRELIPALAGYIKLHKIKSIKILPMGRSTKLRNY